MSIVDPIFTVKQPPPERRGKNLIGEKISHLQVISYSHSEIGGYAFWVCLCDCGNICVVSGEKLQSSKGGTKSCGRGCLKRGNSAVDISGQVFGRLTALYLWEVSRRGGRNIHLWLFLCDCGQTKVCIKSNVLGGSTTSCGCYMLEQLAEGRDNYFSTHDVSGPNCAHWKGGKDAIIHNLRNSKPYRDWRKAVVSRDQGVCQECSAPGAHAHHVIHFSKLVAEHGIKTLEEGFACEALWDTNNGILMCFDCHQKQHPKINFYAIRRSEKRK